MPLFMYKQQRIRNYHSMHRKYPEFVEEWFGMSSSVSIPVLILNVSRYYGPHPFFLRSKNFFYMRFCIESPNQRTVINMQLDKNIWYIWILVCNGNMRFSLYIIPVYRAILESRAFICFSHVIFSSTTTPRKRPSRTCSIFLVEIISGAGSSFSELCRENIIHLVFLNSMLYR